MKKSITLLVTIFSLSLEAYQSYPCCINTNNFYAEIFGGANFLQTQRSGGIKSTYKTGYIVSGSLGYKYCYGLRLEAEYAFRRNSLQKIHFFGRSFNLSGHLESSSYMANLLWDLPIECWGCTLWNLKPFIGAGIGYDNQHLHAKSAGLNFKHHKRGFAWQFIAGLKYPIFCDTDLSFEYKLHHGRLKHIYSHSIGIGLTYSFGG